MEPTTDVKAVLGVWLSVELPVQAMRENLLDPGATKMLESEAEACVLSTRSFGNSPMEMLRLAALVKCATACGKQVIIIPDKEGS